MGKKFAATIILGLLLLLVWKTIFTAKESSLTLPTDSALEGNGQLESAPAYTENETNSAAPTLKEIEESTPVAEIQEAPTGEEVEDGVEEGKSPTWPKDTVEFEIREGKYAVGFGDVILGVVPEDRRNLKRAYFEPPASRLWGSATIPYSIEAETPNKQLILEAIDYFARETPVRFVPRKDEADSIVFIPAKETCASQLGRVGGHQVILVGPNCGKGNILHELMHALGFVHEHSREDRDRFLDVVWSNIKPEYYNQFQMVPDKWVHEYRGSVFDFDPKSVMLYPSNAFAIDPSRVTLKSKVGPIQPRQDELSAIDKERVYYLYGH